eukprot:m.46951 g.46951  ORF g.46951 m.46951 type:complete len:805 (+) comp6825_c0_seq1:178-2592(+)
MDDCIMHAPVVVCVAIAIGAMGSTVHAHAYPSERHEAIEVHHTIKGTVQSASDAPVTMTTIPTAVPLYGTFDIAVDLDRPSGSGTNPFNGTALGASAVFTSPSGPAVHVTPFYYQNYTRSQNKDGTEHLEPLGSTHFRVRFTPEVPAQWTWTLTGCSAGGSTTGTFNVVADGSHRPFVRVSEGGHYFAAGDAPVFLLGQDIVFPGRDPILTTYNYTNLYKYANWSTYMYDIYLTKMAAQGGNYVRLWIGLSCNATGATPLSLAGGPAGSFGRYDLEAAWRIEYIIQLAERLGINVLLCFEAQQSLQMLFNVSVYAASQGGPLTKPTDWWMNKHIRDEFKQRLLYAVSRYGYSTSLFSWQMFNEWNDFPGYNTAPALPLFQEYKAFVVSVDPYRHLIHNSFGADPVAEFLPELPFATYHRYGPPDMTTYAADHIGPLGTASGIPFFWGEFGLNTNGPDDGTAWWTQDASNMHVHNALWASMVSGAAGGAMHWWWHEFDDHDAYREFAPVRAFVSRLPLLNHTWGAFQLSQANNGSAPTPSPPSPPVSCNTTAYPSSHFDTSVGTVVSNALVLNATACRTLCCHNTQCDGWVYTTHQIKSARPPCVLGGPCCWLKSGVGVMDLEPLVNCTAGVERGGSGSGNVSWMVYGMRGQSRSLPHHGKDHGTMVNQRLARGVSTASDDGSTQVAHVPSSSPDTGISAGINDTLVMWIHNPANTWTNQYHAAASVLVGPLTLAIPLMATGEYNVDIVNTTTGAIEHSSVSHVAMVPHSDGLHVTNGGTSASGVLSIAVPAFHRDCAVLATLKG